MIVQLLPLVLWLARLPCLPTETDTSPPTAEPAPAEASPAAPATPAPVAVAKPAAAEIFSGAAPPVSPPRRPAPPQSPFVAEIARYRVSCGVFGEVAQATIAFTPGAGSSQSLVRATATGEGAVLGFGKTKKHVESEFDTRSKQPTRWTMTRTQGSEIVIDTAEQAKAGAVSVVRKRAGQPDLADSMSRAAAVLDPLGLLLRLRVAPLNAPSSFEILDGRALWVVTLSAARPTPERLLRLDGRAEPIYWEGSPDKERTAREFSIYLSNDGYRIPVRLTVPFAMGEVRAELVQVSRPDESKYKFLRHLLKVIHLRQMLLSARDRSKG